MSFVTMMTNCKATHVCMRGKHQKSYYRKNDAKCTHFIGWC